jgi:hypothetical protein
MGRDQFSFQHPLKPSPEVFSRIRKSRGWSEAPLSTKHLIDEMKTRGLNEEQIAHEILTIEISALEMILK